MAGFGTLSPFAATGDESGMAGLDPADVTAALGKAGDVASRTWIGQLLASTLAPGRAVQGQYATTPEVPGQWSDEDQARSVLNANAEADQAPDAPFKKTWPELLLKRAVREAVEGGHDQIAWPEGAVHADRYDLSQHVREIEYVPNGDGTYKLGIADHQGEPIRSMPGIDANRMTLDEIGDTVGKEIAEKIQNGEGKGYRGHEGKTLEGLDLKVGDKGMVGFYDNMLPNIANKLFKRYGTKTAPTPFMGRTAHVLKITPELRKAAQEGFPLFSAGVPLPRSQDDQQ